MLTPKRIIYPASSNPHEILIACEDANGNPINRTIVDETLGKRLASTPEMIANPARPDVETAVFELVASRIAIEEKIAATEQEKPNG